MGRFQAHQPLPVSPAYLTFVLRKTSDRPTRLPRLVPETKLQWRRHFLAGHRRARRLAAAAKGMDEDGIPRSVLEEVREGVMRMGASGGRRRDREVGKRTIERGEREVSQRYSGERRGCADQRPFIARLWRVQCMDAGTRRW